MHRQGTNASALARWGIGTGSLSSNNPAHRWREGYVGVLSGKTPENQKPRDLSAKAAHTNMAPNHTGTDSAVHSTEKDKCVKSPPPPTLENPDKTSQKIFLSKVVWVLAKLTNIEN